MVGQPPAIAIIGGASPHLLNLPYKEWCASKAATVYGINDFAYSYEAHVDWMVVMDSHRLLEWTWAQDYRKKGMRLAARRPNPECGREKNLTQGMADYWYGHEKPDHYSGPLIGTNLCYVSTTATAAVDLAIRQNNRAIILTGVDLCSGHRANGTKYGKANHWGIHLDGVNARLHFLMEASGVQIYKTNIQSSLQVPFVDIPTVNRWLLE